MAHNARATLTDLPDVNDLIGSPLQIIKANPNLLTELLCPNTGYMQRVQEVYNYKKNTKTEINDCYVMDRLTLILDIDDAILKQFKWTDILCINQEIEYDHQNASITELHYIVQTQKTVINNDDNNDDIGNVSCITSKSKSKDKNNKFNNYLAHITSEKHEIPIIGGYINGKEILSVSIYQIVIEIEPDSPHFGSITKTVTIDTQYDLSCSITTSNEMETPIPTTSIIIDMNDDTDKINKISIDKILKTFTDDIIKINNIYIALRPHLDEFLFLSQRLFDDIILFTTNEKKNMEGIIKAVHNYLIDKLSRNKKECNKKNKYKLWKDVKYRDYCDMDNECLTKNICKFGIDLSRIILIDNNCKYFKGFEPNCIEINKYIINNNDAELMDNIWPILFECYKYNDIRYGLIGKQKMANTNPISIESDSLAQTMQYLVVLQYTYFKFTANTKNYCRDLKSIEFGNGNDSSVYTTDDDYYYEQSDTETEKEIYEQYEQDEYGINQHQYNSETKIEPSFSCSSVFHDIGDIFNNMSSYFGKSVSK
eukprot:392316_1